MKLRHKVPEVVRALNLDERRLAWGVTTDGRPVVATPTGVHVGDRMVAWTELDKATWQPPVLTLVETHEVEGQGQRHVLELADEDRLAQTIRAGVTSSVAWTDVRRLAPAGKVRLVARRVLGQDAMLWQIVYLDGTDPADPHLRAQAEELVAELRASLG